MEPSQKVLKSFNYEVFGKVQGRFIFISGVFFRKYTKEQARKLGVVGWIKNTDRGTVEGIIQGESPLCDQM